MFERPHYVVHFAPQLHGYSLGLDIDELVAPETSGKPWVSCEQTRLELIVDDDVRQLSLHGDGYDPVKHVPAAGQLFHDAVTALDNFYALYPQYGSYLPVENGHGFVVGVRRKHLHSDDPQTPTFRIPPETLGEYARARDLGCRPRRATRMLRHILAGGVDLSEPLSPEGIILTGPLEISMKANYAERR